MPVIDVDLDELRGLVGTDADDATLIADLFELGLEHEGRTEEGAEQFEFGPDRLDRLSVEGVARSLRQHYDIAPGLSVPHAASPEYALVAEDVPADRPHISGLIVRGLDLTDAVLTSVIQLQEKLHATMGRRRAKGAIGIHDLTMLKPITDRIPDRKALIYRGVDPAEETFVPLGADRAMTPAEVCAELPTGRRYGELVDVETAVPGIVDDLGLFSFPPVINGSRTELATDTHAVLVELTGTDQWTIDRMATILGYALVARGGDLEAVEVVTPEATLRRPTLDVETKRVAHADIERTLGVELSPETVRALCGRAGLDATVDDGTYAVSVPPYRVDVLHPVDVIDDIGRAYGFTALEPRVPDVATIGGRHPRSRLRRALRERLVGMGVEDMLTFHLSSPAVTQTQMRLDAADAEVLGAQQPVRITSPYSEEYPIVRQWLLPSLVQVLANNTHRRYPQVLGEVGHVLWADDGATDGVAEADHIAVVVAAPTASFEDAKAVCASLTAGFDVALATPAVTHPSFIEGRAAALEVEGTTVGVLGELHPQIITDAGIEVPVSAFECAVSAFETDDSG